VEGHPTYRTDDELRVSPAHLLAQGVGARAPRRSLTTGPKPKSPFELLGVAIAELPASADPAAGLVEAGVAVFGQFALDHASMFRPAGAANPHAG
jgi:hypothetical protein